MNLKSRNRIPGLAHLQLEPIYPGGFTFRDEANALVAQILRNGPLEDIHAASDGGSRISDEEMKAIMIHACRQLEDLLTQKFYQPQAYFSEIAAYGVFYCRGWNRTRGEDQKWMGNRKKQPK